MLDAQLTRRGFLGLSLATVAALYGCDVGFPNQTTPSVPFGIWAEQLKALRASPDFIAAQADKVVASKDPKAIFEFVRDSIATYPPIGPNTVATDMRWGVRATLRGGAGTPREKAEVLASLYKRAGVQAQVVSGSLAVTAKATPQSVYLKRPALDFAPAIDQATLDRYAKAMGRTSRPQRLKPPDRAEAEAIAGAVLGTLPRGFTAGGNPTFNSRLLDEVPLVAVTVNGKTVYANPIVPGAVFGQSYLSADPTPAQQPSPTQTVRIGLSVTTGSDPARRVVVEATYSAEDLAGRQLMAMFTPAVPAERLLGLRLRDLQRFVPVLSVIGADVDEATSARLTHPGTVLTSSGDMLAKGPDGSVTLNGVPVASPATSDAKAADRVASLTLEANAAAFPRVSLKVKALDAAGNPVTGLPPAAFRVKDEQQPVGVLLSGTPSQGPRVMLIVDLDENLDTLEDPKNLARQLTNKVLSAYPNGAIQVAGGDMKAYDLLRDPEAVVKEIGSGDSDDAWTALAEANRQRPDLIVIASEFHIARAGAVTDADRAAVAAGSPVIAVGVDGKALGGSGFLDRDTMNQIVKLSHGQALPSGGIDATVSAVLNFLQQHAQAATYTLEYDAPADAPARRGVTISRADGKALATATYSVPAPAQRASPAALSGIYLEMTSGQLSTVRTIATGDQVRAALFSPIVISFEAGAPSLSTKLADLLTVQLGLKPLVDAVNKKDAKAIRANLKAASNYAPAALSVMQCPPWQTSDGASLTYETGLRAVAYSTQPVFGKGFSTRVDVLPMTQWNTLAADYTRGLYDSLAHSAKVAQVESMLFTTSAVGALAGKPLRGLPPGFVSAEQLTWMREAQRQSAASALNQYKDYHRAVPADGSLPAFWAMDAGSGSLLGVLPDGTGGGSSAAACAGLDEGKILLDLAGALGSLIGFTGFGAFVVVGIKVLEVVTIVNLIFEDALPPGFDAGNTFKDMGQGMVCGIGKDLAASTIGKLVPALEQTMKNYGAADSMLDTIGKGLPACKGPGIC